MPVKLVSSSASASASVSASASASASASSSSSTVRATAILLPLDLDDELLALKRGALARVSVGAAIPDATRKLRKSQDKHSWGIFHHKADDEAPQPALFGGSLTAEDGVSEDDALVCLGVLLRVMEECCAFILAHGLTTTGVLRIPGDRTVVNAIKAKFEADAAACTRSGRAVRSVGASVFSLASNEGAALLASAGGQEQQVHTVASFMKLAKLGKRKGQIFYVGRIKGKKKQSFVVPPNAIIDWSDESVKEYYAAQFS